MGLHRIQSTRCMRDLTWRRTGEPAWWVRLGMSPRAPLAPIPVVAGRDYLDVVVEVGDDVTKAAIGVGPGDRDGVREVVLLKRFPGGGPNKGPGWQSEALALLLSKRRLRLLSPGLDPSGSSASVELGTATVDGTRPIKLQIGQLRYNAFVIDDEVFRIASAPTPEDFHMVASAIDRIATNVGDVETIDYVVDRDISLWND